ncbi:hypothetical protein [uncultured Erythrobacter sp.]|uniref:DUF4139 domain-containing protein n=1 Tax=uncultured Erythrobacter sp. TaxID=263913 RepID=UPI002604EF90|nr:hypothetical protein [uncultured Erythrobacter sp.]
MRFVAFLFVGLSVLVAKPLEAREIVYAAESHDTSVTIYRDPDRGEREEMDADDPRGFAMISETRRVTLPAGESTIRFIGVAEGMIGVSAIVTGLPGGTIEMNRNAELLSPAALVNGTLGNRVTITRTNPATGEAVSQPAIVRTRADGGLVLQIGSGFEAVRCAGLPESLRFSRVPEGLSAKPVFSIDTRDESGGSYEVTLTYLAWGFDWQANYVAMMEEGGRSEEFGLDMLSWLTVLNDNGQSFDNANLLVVAGRLNIDSDYERMARSPTGEPLRLTCYPFGSTAAGSPIVNPASPMSLYAIAPAPAPTDAIVVTATRRESRLQDSPMAVTAMSSEVMEASEEELGDLKLYRVPERVNVAAQSTKQIAFLNREEVEAGFVYSLGCSPRFRNRNEGAPGVRNANILLVTRNDEERGLGVALPQGALNLFEPSRVGPMLVSSNFLRDYAVGQEIELRVGTSGKVSATCEPLVRIPENGDPPRRRAMQSSVSNDNDHPVLVRVVFGRSGVWNINWRGGETRIKDGMIIGEITVPADSEVTLNWSATSTG